MESKLRIAIIAVVAFSVGYIVGQQWKVCPVCSPMPQCKVQEPCPVFTQCPKNEDVRPVGDVASPESNLVCGALIDSLRERGAYIHSNLAINDTSSSAAQGREIIARAAIDPATVLFSIPDTLALVSHSVWTRLGLATGVKLKPRSLRTIYLHDDDTASVIKALV